MKGDVLNSWGFLSDQDFAVRALGVIALGFIPGAAFGNAVYPVRNEDGDLLVRNIAAAGFLGAFLGLCLLLVVLFRLAQVWDSVNKALQRKTFVVEYDPTGKLDFASGPAGAYNYRQAKSEKEIERDKLIAEYETEPAVSRLRVYLVGTIAATVTALVGSINVGGEVLQAKEEEEEEEGEQEYDPDEPRFYKAKKKKACKEGCIPGLSKD